MGYTTEFEGVIGIEPRLNAEEISYLMKFSQTRRMDRRNGPYFVDGTGMFGQGDDEDIINHNAPPDGQPGLWCQWSPTEDGLGIEWNGAEKFYDAAEWMTYIIDHFLKPGAQAASVLPFLQGHVLNGEIDAQGEEDDDKWKLVVRNNVVVVA